MSKYQMHELKQQAVPTTGVVSVRVFTCKFKTSERLGETGLFQTHNPRQHTNNNPNNRNKKHNKGNMNHGK